MCPPVFSEKRAAPELVLRGGVVLSCHPCDTAVCRLSNGTSDKRLSRLCGAFWEPQPGKYRQKKRPRNKIPGIRVYIYVLCGRVETFSRTSGKAGIERANGGRIKRSIIAMPRVCRPVQSPLHAALRRVTHPSTHPPTHCLSRIPRSCIIHSLVWPMDAAFACSNDRRCYFSALSLSPPPPPPLLPSIQ